ncbi:hypothetical protein C8R44DRAFT_976329 [Mycena epipterygia]|nr:hypothetical protein C8R44DRAFT_976329 [Mycena epipterygia]
MTPCAIPAPSLIDLPNELLVEIVSYHTYTFDFLSPVVYQDYWKRRQPRRKTLRSLSQSCSVLRSVSLPLLWERFDVYNPDFRSPQSEIAACIFPYIKYVHISTQWWPLSSISETIPLLVDFLCTLPKLTGLEIYENRLDHTIFSIISSAFSKVSLPTVSVLLVPQELRPIFRAFPHLRTLVFQTVHKDSSALMVRQYFTHIDALAGLRICHRNEEFLILATDRFPGLRVLSIASPFKIEFEPCFRRLTAFTNLSELVLFHVEDGSQFLSLEALVAGGRDVLRASQSRETKVLRVWANDTSEAEGHLVHVERF